MPTAAAEFQHTLGQLASHLGNRVAALLSHMDSRLSFDESLRFIADAYPHLVEPFASTAAQIAAQWYNDHPTDGRPYTAKPVSTLPTDRLAASGRWSLVQANPAQALRGSAQRAVFDCARQTIVYNAQREPGATYARYASANACAFCRVMATRGDVYESAYSATRVVARSGSQQRGEKYHDHCHCIAAVVRPGYTYHPPDYVDAWKKEYTDAVAAARAERSKAGESGPPGLNEIVQQMYATGGDADKRAQRYASDKGKLPSPAPPRVRAEPPTQKPYDAPPPAPAPDLVFAKHQIEVLTENLAKLREQGMAEDSPPIRYHEEMIAKFRKQVDDAKTSAPVGAKA